MMLYTVLLANWAIAKKCRHFSPELCTKLWTRGKFGDGAPTVGWCDIDRDSRRSVVDSTMAATAHGQIADC